MDGTGREFARECIVPVDQILGRRTLAAVRSFQKASAAILKRPTRPGRRRLPDYEPLTPWRALVESQCSELRAILNDPESYWTGQPRYRRLPPRPGFSVQLAGPTNAIILIDLQNPGWEMYCEHEEYWGFNFAGRRLRALAKSIFPEYASASRNGIWKRQQKR